MGQSIKLNDDKIFSLASITEHRISFDCNSASNSYPSIVYADSITNGPSTGDDTNWYVITMANFGSRYNQFAFQYRGTYNDRVFMRVFNGAFQGWKSIQFT